MGENFLILLVICIILAIHHYFFEVPSRDKLIYEFQKRYDDIKAKYNKDITPEVDELINDLLEKINRI